MPPKPHVLLLAPHILTVAFPPDPLARLQNTQDGVEELPCFENIRVDVKIWLNPSQMETWFPVPLCLESPKMIHPDVVKSPRQMAQLGKG